MKYLFIIFSLILAPMVAYAGRCEGGYCNVCTNCSRCAYCGAGGTCSVCAGTGGGRSSSHSSHSSGYSSRKSSSSKSTKRTSAKTSKVKTGDSSGGGLDDCCAGIYQSLNGERFPQTRRAALSTQQINALSDADLRYAINEIYARYGLIFKDASVQKQFCQRSWYRPRVKRTAPQIEKLMTKTEKSNLKALVQSRSRRATLR